MLKHQIILLNKISVCYLRSFFRSFQRNVRSNNKNTIRTKATNISHTLEIEPLFIIFWIVLRCTHWFHLRSNINWLESRLCDQFPWFCGLFCIRFGISFIVFRSLSNTPCCIIEIKLAHPMVENISYWEKSIKFALFRIFITADYFSLLFRIDKWIVEAPYFSFGKLFYLLFLARLVLNSQNMCDWRWRILKYLCKNFDIPDGKIQWIETNNTQVSIESFCVWIKF